MGTGTARGGRGRAVSEDEEVLTEWEEEEERGEDPTEREGGLVDLFNGVDGGPISDACGKRVAGDGGSVACEEGTVVGE